MLSNIWNIEASLILIDSTGRIESSTFTISVTPSTVDDESVESENSFTALTEALVKVNDLEDNYAPRLNEVTAQLAQNANYRTIESFGAIGDGISDDTEAIRNAIENTPEGSKLLTEGKRYKITDTILVDKQINVELLGTFLYDGIKDRPAFTFNGLQFKDIKIGKVINTNQDTPDWSNQNFIGVDLIDLFNCKISVDEANNFYVGYKTTSKNAGFWFNDVTFKRAINCLIGHEICSDGSSGWLNNNIFRELSVTYSGNSYRTNEYYRYSVLQTLKNGNTYGGNTNVFYSYRFETSSSSPANWTQVKLLKSNGWQFKDTRLEMVTSHNFLEIDLSSFTAGASSVSHTRNISFEFLPPVLSHNNLPIVDFIKLENLQCSISGVVSFNYYDPFEPKYENDSVLFTERIKRLTDKHVSLRGLRRLPRNASSLSEEVCNAQYGSSDFPLITSDGFAKILYRPSVRLLEVENGDVIKIDAVIKTGRPIIKLLDNAGSIISDAVVDGANKIGTEMYYDSPNNNYVYGTDRDEYVISVHSDDIKYLVVLLMGECKSISIKSNRQTLSVKSSYLFPKLDVMNIVESDVKPTSGESGYNSIGDIVYNFDRSSGQVIGWQLSADGVTWNTLGTRT